MLNMYKDINPKILIIDFICFCYLQTNNSNLKKIPFGIKRPKEINFKANLNNYKNLLEKIVIDKPAIFSNFDFEAFKNNRTFINDYLTYYEISIKELIENNNLNNFLGIEENVFISFQNTDSFKILLKNYIDISTYIKSVFPVGFITSLFYIKVNKALIVRDLLNNFYAELQNSNEFFEDFTDDLYEFKKKEIIKDLSDAISKKKFQYFGEVIYLDNRINFKINIEKSFNYWVGLFNRLSFLIFPYNSNVYEEISYLKLKILEDIQNGNNLKRNETTKNLLKELNSFKQDNYKLLNHLRGYFNNEEIDIIINCLTGNKYEELGIQFIDLSNKDLLKPDLFKYLYFFQILSFYNEEDIIKFNFTKSKGFQNLNEKFNFNWTDCNELQKLYKGCNNQNNTKNYPFKKMNVFIDNLKRIGFKSVDFNYPK